MSQASGGGPLYLRAVDPFPLESPQFNKLHEFYAHVAAGRLTTTRCGGCGRIDWPPRGFCPACKADAFDWVELPPEGRVHAFTVQETGVPVGFSRGLIFAIVELSGLWIFAPLVGVSDARELAIGTPVRFIRVQVADEPPGRPRFLPAFAPVGTGP